MNLLYRNNIDSNKNLLNYNTCIKLLDNKKNLKLIGEGLNGEIFIVSSKSCGSVVIKLSKHKKNNDMFKREINFMTLIKPLITNNICPNFIYTYNFTKEYILMEYADGDLDSLFKKDLTFEKKIIDNFNFQILIGILVMQKNLFMVHYDLQLKNIFYKKISTSYIKLFEYNINGVKYYLENLGYLIMIADLGNSQSLLAYGNENWFNYEKINEMIITNYDFNYLKLTYYKMIINFFLNYIKIKTTQDLFNIIDINKPNLKKYYNELIEQYDLNKDEKKIIKKIIIFIVENKLIDYKKYTKNYDYYLLSDEFEKFISNIYDSVDDITDVIKNNFSSFTKININNLSSKQIKKFYIKYDIFI